MCETKKEIPLVFSADDNYCPFLGVALRSILDNASPENFYKVYVLNTEISQENIDRISQFNCENMLIKFIDVASRMDKINKDMIHLRDYYTKAIYYRIFIPSLFPQYDKVLYLDCDIVVLEDIANLYNYDVEDNIFVAIHEETMTYMDVFGRYSEEFLGVKRESYFNSGILLINSIEYKKQNIEERFIELMHKQKFEVAPDQDYLNYLCKDKVKFAEIGWNKTTFMDKPFDDKDLKLIHYKLNLKPWRYDGIRYEKYFWQYAEKTCYYKDLLKMKEDFTEADKKADDEAFVTLQNTAVRYMNSGISYKTFFGKKVDDAI